MGKTNYDKFKSKFMERQRSEGDDRFWKPECPGRHRVRILPPPDSYDMWYMEYGVHYGITREDGEFETVTCPRITMKQRCYICELAKPMWKDDEPTARKLWVKRRYVTNVLVLSKSESEVKLWAFGPMIMKQLESHCVTEDGSVIPIDDASKGINFKLIATQTQTPDGVMPQYMISPEATPCAIKDMSALKRTHDFVELIQGRVKSYDEIRALMMGADSRPAQEPAHAAKKEQAAEETEIVESDADAGGSGDQEVIEKETPDAATEAPRTSNEDLVRKAREALQKRAAAKQ